MTDDILDDLPHFLRDGQSNRITQVTDNTGKIKRGKKGEKQRDKTWNTLAGQLSDEEFEQLDKLRKQLKQAE